MVLCRSSHLRNSSVFTHFHYDGSTATSSATSEHGAVPERPGRNEEPNSINEDRTGNALIPSVVFSLNLAQ